MIDLGNASAHGRGHGAAAKIATSFMRYERRAIALTECSSLMAPLPRPGRHFMPMIHRTYICREITGVSKPI